MKKTKGKTILTNRQKEAIRTEATRNRLNSRQIVEKLGLPVTKQHVAKILRTSKNIVWKKMQSKPKLTPQHKTNRLLFAQKYMGWKDEWKNVIFSDEKKFNLDGPDCYSCYWHHKGSEEVPRSKRNFGGGSVMVWGAFHYDGKLPLCFITTRMNSNLYNEMLEDVLVNFYEEQKDVNGREDFIFQQDNASIHVSKQSTEWFRQKNIPLLDWPACSPDCNPIKNLWGVLAGKVYANGRQFGTVLELKLCIKECWREIGQDLLRNLATSMPKRIFEVIKNQGGHTKY